MMRPVRRGLALFAVLGLVLASVLRVDHFVHAVRLTRDHEMERRSTPLGTCSDRVEQAAGGRRLMRDDENMGRV